MRKLFFCLVPMLVGLCLASGISAQTKVDEEKYYLAENYMESLEFEMALGTYQELLAVNPDNGNLNFKVGFCLSKIFEKKFDAINYYEKAVPYISKNPDSESAQETKAPIETYFFLGELYQLDCQFDKALENFKKFRSFITIDNAEVMKMLNKKDQECNTGLVLLKTKGKGEVFAIEALNTDYADHSPIFIGDESQIVFSSSRQGSTGGKIYEGYNFYDDIWISDNVNGEWQKPRNMGHEMNTIRHDAAVGISVDGLQLLVYVYDDRELGDIYISKFVNGDWSGPDPVKGGVNTRMNETDAAFSADGKYILFSSLRKDGFGGLDMYQADLMPDGSYWNVRNLGDVLNTPFDERSPYLHPDGKTLYFASNGPGSMGGFDIFQSNLVDGKWSAPVNLGFPINSPDDDVFFMPTFDGVRAYYSSKKKGGKGDFDIYMVKFGERTAYASALISGNMFDKEGGLLMNPEIIIIDKNTGKEIRREKANSVTGKYVFSLDLGKNYEIVFKGDNYISHYTDIDLTDNKEYTEINHVIKGSPVNDGQTDFIYELCAGENSKAPGADFDRNLGYLAEDLAKNKNIVAEIAVDPENVEYTKKINEIMTKLTAQNVPAASIVQTRTKVTDPNVIGIRVMDIATYKVVQGEILLAQQKRTADSLALLATKIHAADSLAMLAANNHTADSLAALAVNNPPNDGKTNDGKTNDGKTNGGNQQPVAAGELAIHSIPFGYGKSTSWSEAAMLIELALFMQKNPGLVIELNGHTDILGSDENNMELSRKRAEFIKSVLVYKGANADNIKVVYAGSTKPIAINKNADGTDCRPGRKLNRRVEFRIVTAGGAKLQIVDAQVPQDLKAR
ncbi:MAG: OmpA family protein [Bacteroidetes bacterium]|nr:OmpA family protein [Bacteroidota bacterium]